MAQDKRRNPAKQVQLNSSRFKASMSLLYRRLESETRYIRRGSRSSHRAPIGSRLSWTRQKHRQARRNLTLWVRCHFCKRSTTGLQRRAKREKRWMKIPYLRKMSRSLSRQKQVLKKTPRLLSWCRVVLRRTSKLLSWWKAVLKKQSKFLTWRKRAVSGMSRYTI